MHTFHASVPLPVCSSPPNCGCQVPRYCPCRDTFYYDGLHPQELGAQVNHLALELLLSAVCCSNKARKTPSSNLSHNATLSNKSRTGSQPPRDPQNTTHPTEHSCQYKHMMVVIKFHLCGKDTLASFPTLSYVHSFN